jgi:Methyltransferase domain
MEHFYQNIEGWFCFESIYDHAVQTALDNAHFIEVGAWKGKSTAYMAVLIANSGKTIKFDVVDTWKGSSEHQTLDSIINNVLYDEFTENMKPVKLYYTPLKMTSVEAASLYEDESLDFILIDANHDYDPVKADLIAWLPKLKIGGTIAGDDYPWPGVTQAVNEVIGSVQLSCGSGDSYCWSYKKTI